MISPSQDLILTGFPGWFGSRFLELFLQRPEGLYASLPWKRVIALVEPERLEHATQLLKRLSPLGTERTTEIIPLDLSDEHACSALTLTTTRGVFVHAAGIIHPKRTRDFFRINTKGTEHFLGIALRHQAQRIVYISSNSPCGSNPTATHRFTSASPYLPYMGYGKSKMLAEQLLSHWSAIHAIPATILRPCWFFGPHQPERQARFFQMVFKGMFPVLGKGQHVRSLTFVDDLVQAAMRAALSEANGTHTYWIALEQPPTTLELVETVRTVMREEFSLQPRERTIFLPYFLSTIARWADAALQRAGFYQQELHVVGELGLSIACSVEEAKRELGFRPTNDLRTVVLASLAWAQAHNQGVHID